MPYEMKGKCVYKKGATNPLKCFKTTQEAKDYLAALYANVKDAKSQLDGVPNLWEVPKHLK